MILKDTIYGEFSIQEPIIAELLSCKDFVRLKGVSQSGMGCFPTRHDNTNYSRFEHSIGVMLLLRSLNATLEEQIAGLLHDSSHTAFSHVIDFVFNTRGAENYAEEDLYHFIERTELGKILLNYGYDIKRVGKPEVEGRFRLLEQPVPRLCADRIDNALRYMHYAGLNIEGIISDIAVFDGEIVLKSRASAKKLASGFLHGTKSEWGNLDKGFRAHFLAEAIRIGLESKVLDVSQFYKQDEASIIKILESSKNPLILSNLNNISAELKYVFDENGNIEITEKVRYLDPVFIEDGKKQRLTDVDLEYKKEVEKENAILAKTYKVRLKEVVV